MRVSRGLRLRVLREGTVSWAEEVLLGVGLLAFVLDLGGRCGEGSACARVCVFAGLEVCVFWKGDCMGDSERWWPELASGLSAEGAHSFRAAFGTFRGKGEEWWAMAELRVAELITTIQPKPESEFRRQAVVDYITKLIQSCVNCEVVKFGSVPLKTYLPDGDIDLTVVSPNLESKRTWIEDVHNVLQKEINNPKSEFRITQVQLVVAEVKLIKIYVEKSLLVDVSFDQVGGVCTLCFLEEVDRLIEDHLFKRSIILVKAWCYYESRLLGANCNLMSTYALETLVLYIFHLFHASLRGPLQVLYLFLEFFSSFDWDKYCVSLLGPILLASFSEETERQSIIAEDFQRLALSAGGEGGELLFTKAFLDNCERTYGLMRVNPIAKSTKFPVKSLNIIDPLRRTNNLGRSVNHGNCARIRRAFVLGARTLRGILHGSEADVCSALNQFFKNCNERYDGSTPRPDVAVPRSWPGTRIPNGVQRMGGGRRSDIARTERNEDAVSNGCVSENGDHPPQARLSHNVLRVDPRDPTVRETSEEALGNGVEYEGGGIVSPCAVDLASVRAENSNDSAVNLTSVAGEELAALNLLASVAGEELATLKTIAMNGPNGDLMAHDSRHNDEEPIHSDVPISKRIPIETGSLQTVFDRLPIRSGAYEGDEASPGMFSERNTSGGITREGLESLVRKMGRTRVLQQVTAVNGSEHSTNGSTSPSSKNESEEEEESSSQSSSSKGEASASKNITALPVSDSKRGLQPLSSRPENFESSRHGSSSELQGRPPDPQRSPLDVSGAETEVQRPSSYSEPLKSIRNESEREVSVPVDEFMHTGNNPGFEIPTVTEMSQSKVPVHKGKIHQQNGTLQSNDFGSGPGHVKRKRGPGKEKRHGRAAGMVTQDGGQVSSSGVTAHIPQQSSGLASVYQHPPPHSSTDYATSGTYFKTSQSRPYPNATGPGSFRHQFDPGTTRMTGGNNSASSHSSDPHYMPSYYMPFPSGFPHPSMYSSGMNNFHKRNSPARGDGSSGVNATSRTDQETIEPVPSDNAVDSPSHKSQSKVMPQVVVGVVERLEADGVAVSTSSRRNQTAAAARNNTHGAGVPSGNSNSEFLTGDLKRHLELLAYGRFCEDCCSPSLQYPIGYPAYSSEQLAHTHGSWEGPGRPAQLMGHPAFYPTGPGWLPLFPQQAGYLPQFQPYWGPRGVELSPRPRGTGTYLPTTQLRQNIKVPSGRGRGGGQNGSQHPEADKYHHQAHEHENSHRFHGAHHRASMNKDEAHSQGAVYGTPTSIRVVENRSTSKAERARDSHHQKHEFSKASHSLPMSPSISSPRADVPDELPQPSELLPRITTDVGLVTDPVVVRKSSSDDSSGPSAFEMLSGSSEDNVGPAPPPVSEFLYSEEAEAVLDGGQKSGPQLKRSSSVGHSYDQIVQTDGPVVISDFPFTVADVIPTATAPSQRDGRLAYHMKEEDFPPLGGRIVNRGEVATGGTSSITSNGISRFISL